HWQCAPTYFSSRAGGLYGPRDASLKDAGGRAIEQGNRRSTGHQGADGQGARSQADAQGWSGESGRTHSACHYTLAGFPALKFWQTHLKLSEPGERLLKHRASEPHHDEMFSYDPLHGGSLRPNCSGCQFRASDFAPRGSSAFSIYEAKPRSE